MGVTSLLINVILAFSSKIFSGEIYLVGIMVGKFIIPGQEFRAKHAR